MAAVASPTVTLDVAKLLVAAKADLTARTFSVISPGTHTKTKT